MSEIPDDIMKAAYDCARGIYLSVDDAYTPYMTDDDVEAIAKAILTERQRSASLKALCDEMAKILLKIDEAGINFPGHAFIIGDVAADDILPRIRAVLAAAKETEAGT